MRHTTLALLVGGALALPAAVSAQDFAGPSVGLQLSYGDASTEGPALEGDGALYGLRAYYDFDPGTFIYGFGLQYDATDISLGGGTAEIDEVLRLAGRIGVTSGANWYYGTLGYARAYTSGPAAAGDSDGFFVGVGYEVFVSDEFTVGTELLYHEFSDFDIGTLDADVTTLSFSVNYRF